MPFNTFTLPAGATILYPQDDWIDADEVTVYENRSVEVRNLNSVGAWEFSVTIVAKESAADTIFTFLRNQRLRGIPFNFAHRKRGTLLVRYWSNRLPMKRAVHGKPDQVAFELPLRAE